mmetsp:Transcript_2343/g.6173  ORF Transcript_2343/g.6173 Transcript_2343/m.6173 type:complete len:485 (-) Transcript_2343:182-1636(-)
MAHSCTGQQDDGPGQRATNPPRDAAPTADAQQELVFAAGDALRLEHAATGHSATLLVEPARGGYLLAQPARPYHRLHRSLQTREVAWRQTTGNASALWRVETCEHAARCCVHIRGVATRTAPNPPCLGLDSKGAWMLIDEVAAAPVASGEEDEQPAGEVVVASDEVDGAVWRLREAPAQNTEQLAPISPDTSSARQFEDRAAFPAFLSEGRDGQPSFARDGYAVLPSLVPAERVARALRYLNHNLGSADLASDLEPEGLGMAWVESTARVDGDVAPAGVVKLGGGRRCTCSMAQAQPLLQLLGAAERRAIAAAAAGSAEAPTRQIAHEFGCQVALRFPLQPFAPGVDDGDAALLSLLARVGLDWHNDAAKYNEKKNFDLTVGVFLSPVRAPSDGCLWVQPGSHITERAAREAGGLNGALLSGAAAAAAPAADRMAGEGGGESAVPILAEPGSVIVFDKDLLHAGGPNLSAGIRYALYYRLRFEA